MLGSLAVVERGRIFLRQLATLLIQWLQWPGYSAQPLEEAPQTPKSLFPSTTVNLQMSVPTSAVTSRFSPAPIPPQTMASLCHNVSNAL